MAKASITLDRYNFDANNPMTILEMQGTPNVAMAYLLRILNLDPQVHFTVTRTHIRFHFVGIDGQTTVTCPLDTITGMYGGLEKPKWALYLAGFMALLMLAQVGGSSLSFIYFLIGAASFAYFWITKGFIIGFSTSDFLDIHGLMFDAVLPNGEKMTEEELLRIIEYINMVLLRSHTSSTIANRDDIPYIPEKPKVKKAPVKIAVEEDEQLLGNPSPDEAGG